MNIRITKGDLRELTRLLQSSSAFIDRTASSTRDKDLARRLRRIYKHIMMDNEI